MLVVQHTACEPPAAHYELRVWAPAYTEVDPGEALPDWRHCLRAMRESLPHHTVRLTIRY